MIQQPDNDEATDKAIIRNEKEKTERPYRTTSLNGTTVKPKWIFEIFHDQFEINGSEKFNSNSDVIMSHVRILILKEFNNFFRVFLLSSVKSLFQIDFSLLIRPTRDHALDNDRDFCFVESI